MAYPLLGALPNGKSARGAGISQRAGIVTFNNMLLSVLGENRIISAKIKVSVSVLVYRQTKGMWVWVLTFVLSQNHRRKPNYFRKNSDVLSSVPCDRIHPDAKEILFRTFVHRFVFFLAYVHPQA